jgi:hypothetical protein
MKLNDKFFLFLVGSLTVSLNTVFLRSPAASEEAQILPPQVLPSCSEKLPILEADKASTGTEAIPVVTAVPSSTDSGTVAPLTVTKADPISTTEIPKQEVLKPVQSSKTEPGPKVSQDLLTSKPLSVPSVEPPTSSRSTSLVKPSYKSLPLAPPIPVSEQPAEPLAQPVIPASPSLPPVGVSSPSTAEIPHTRYLPTPPNSSSDPATSVVSENKPTSLEPESPISTSSNLPATIGCVPASNSTPVVDSTQTEVLPETAKTESPAPSANNDDIEKSIENSERSLKGIRPF